MKSAWVERDAKQAVDRYGKAGIAPDLALRIYSARLLGRDAKLVLHGGGNSSLKTKERDLAGAEVAVLRVKGSGWDMGAIEPAGFPAVRLEPLRALRARKKLSDGEMARAQRAFLIDPQAPSPSVEMLLHAFMPAKFIDHTHATAVLSLIDQPNAAELCAEVFGGRLGFVPYLMPGFGLAKKAAEVFDKNPKVEGLILDKHGIFTFGADARESYERMIEFVTRAENRLKKNRKAVFVAAKLPQQIAAASDVAPILRGACTLRDAGGEGAHKRPILEFRTSDAILNFVNGKDVARYARAGVITPDHVIRTKPWPLIVPAPQDGKLGDVPERRAQGRAKIHRRLQRLFRPPQDARERRRHARSGAARRAGAGPRPVRAGQRRQETPASPPTSRKPRSKASPMRRQSGASPRFRQADMFDMRILAAGTGEARRAQGFAARRPGRGHHRRRRRHRRGDRQRIRAGRRRGGAARSRCRRGEGKGQGDRRQRHRAEMRRDRCRLGARCVCIGSWPLSAASISRSPMPAPPGRAESAKSTRPCCAQSFELNFFAHQKVAQAAVKVMLAQGTGGCLLFNVSKQAVNPGANFGPYGLPKAATLFLVRQYALDYGADGIRANAVNADRIRSGLLTDDFIKQRSKARGVSEKDYMTGNLLGREVTAQDVAQAFLAQALALKTTADVTTVDGGNIAAALR